MNIDKNKLSVLMNPLLLKLNTIFTVLNNNEGKVGVPRILIYKNITLETLEEAVDVLEKKIYKCHSSVFMDLKNLMRIWTRAREHKIPRNENDKTPLSCITNRGTGPHIPNIFKILREPRTKTFYHLHN